MDRKSALVGFLIGIIVGDLTFYLALMSQLSERDRVIDELEARVEQLRGQIEALKGIIDEKDQTIWSIQTSYGALKAEYERLQAEYEALREELSDLKARLPPEEGIVIDAVKWNRGVLAKAGVTYVYVRNPVSYTHLTLPTN